MSATQRRFKSSVATRLLAEPYRFDFFQAVRVMNLWLKSQGMGDDHSTANHIRFENSTSLSFPPSDIESLRATKRSDGLTAQADLATHDSGVAADDRVEHFHLTPSFMGFMGPNGTLPRHYSERLVLHQLTHRDHGPRVFLDTYSNRAVALFYGAWKKYRLEFDFESKGKDGFLPLLRALGGLGHADVRTRLDSSKHGVQDESLAYYTAALRQRPMSATYLQAILNEHFAVPIKITQFVGAWYQLPAENQTRLGLANAVLGSNALSGDRCWQRDLRMGLTIGPLRKKDFERFLPQQTAAVALEQMLKLMVGITLEFEVQLTLHAEDVFGCDLSPHRNGGRLGLDTFLMTRRAQQDRSDVRYTLNAL